eukprot:4509097-Prymnesium_polylepis.1
MCVDNFFSAAAAALEFAAALQLRRSSPWLARPYRVPLGTTGLALFLCVPFGASFVVMAVTASESWNSAAVCLGALLLGVVGALPFARWRSLVEGSCGHVRVQRSLLVAGGGRGGPQESGDELGGGLGLGLAPCGR